MQVEFVSPEAVLFSGECSQVVTRTVDGEIAFLAVSYTHLTLPTKA